MSGVTDYMVKSSNNNKKLRTKRRGSLREKLGDYFHAKRELTTEREVSEEELAAYRKYLQVRKRRRIVRDIVLLAVSLSIFSALLWFFVY